jgi:hypothetical protein
METALPPARRLRFILATDLARQCAVTVALVACLLAGAGSAGLLGGTPIRDAGGGSHSPDETLLSLDARAAEIWSLIYLGLFGYTIFQWWPAVRESARQRSIGWPVAAAMLLTAASVLAAQAGQAGLTLALTLLVLASLGWAVYGLTRHPGREPAEALLADAPIGLFTGWTLLAAAVHAADWLTDRGADLFGWGAAAWAVLAVAAVSFAAAVAAMTGRGRMAVVLGVCWGLGWLLYGRFLGDSPSAPVAMAAGFGLFFVLVCGMSRRFQVGHAERLAIRRGERWD